jgi:hypothetical protein
VDLPGVRGGWICQGLAAVGFAGGFRRAELPAAAPEVFERNPTVCAFLPIGGARVEALGWVWML